MNYIEVADILLNLDNVSFIREEEHSQLGMVLAIHFATTGSDPLFIGTQHHDELRRLLAERGEGHPPPGRSRARRYAPPGRTRSRRRLTGGPASDARGEA